MRRQMSGQCEHARCWQGGQQQGAACVQVDPDKAFAVQITHEEGVVTGPVAYMQCALLYTSSNGERRIRCAPRPPPAWRLSTVSHIILARCHVGHQLANLIVRVSCSASTTCMQPPCMGWCCG